MKFVLLLCVVLFVGTISARSPMYSAYGDQDLDETNKEASNDVNNEKSTANYDNDTDKDSGYDDDENDDEEYDDDLNDGYDGNDNGDYDDENEDDENGVYSEYDDEGGDGENYNDEDDFIDGNDDDDDEYDDDDDEDYDNEDEDYNGKDVEYVYGHHRGHRKGKGFRKHQFDLKHQFHVYRMDDDLHESLGEIIVSGLKHAFRMLISMGSGRDRPNHRCHHRGNHHHHHQSDEKKDWKQYFFHKLNDYMSKHIKDFDSWSEKDKWYLLGLKMFLKHTIKDGDAKLSIKDISEYKDAFLKAAKKYDPEVDTEDMGKWFDKIANAEWIPHLLKKCASKDKKYSTRDFGGATNGFVGAMGNRIRAVKIRRWNLAKDAEI